MPKIIPRDSTPEPLESTLEAPTSRLTRLQGLLDRLVPLELSELKTATRGSGSGEMYPLECRSFDKLIEAWKRALHWTDGLDVALSVMLASIVSTKFVGDQLWIKILSPPSCLDGSTLIYDPVDGTSLTVKERTERGKQFFVWTRFDDGELGVVPALPPKIHGTAEMYELTFESGNKLKVTGGHRIFSGSAYVSVERLQFLSSPLPTISEFDLLTRGQGVLHSMRTAQDCPENCYAYSYLYDEQPQSVRDNDLGAAPSPNDVLEHSRDESSEDDLSVPLRRCTLLQSDHLSKRDVSILSWLPRNVVEFLSCSFLGTFGRSFYQYLRGGNITLWIPHCWRRVLSALFLSPYSTNDALSLFARLEFCLRDFVPPLVGRLSLSGCSPFGKERHTNRSLFGASHVLQPVFSLPQAAEGIFELYPDRQTLENNIRLSCFPLGKVEPVVDISSSAMKQPYFIPISKVRVKVDGLTLTKTDRLVKVTSLGVKDYYDFHVPETNNYWASGFFHHNTGKSRLCEAVSIARKHVIPKSTLRGFHSGFGDGTEDNSLVSKANGMTLVTKDGDTLLQSPNLGQILSEGRDVYDGCSRTSYRNKASKDHEGLRLTWLLAGTSSLKAIDQSELGERFLDCVIMESIDNDVEDLILLRSADQADRDLNLESNGSPDTQQAPEMSKAYRLTGGYIEYLKEISTSTLSTLYFPDEKKLKCAKLGKFVAFLRARPSTKQDEKAEREMASRLVSTHVRLAKCLAMVMNKDEIDDECMRRTKKVALDTASGPTAKIVERLYSAPAGLEVRALELYVNIDNQKVATLLRFLREIGVTKRIQVKKGPRAKQIRWHLSDLMRKLYSEVEEV